MAQKSSLGKGLASLLSATSGLSQESVVSAAATHSPVSPKVVTHDGENKDKILGITMLNFEQIKVNHLQPRNDFDEDSLKELSESILANGIIQPLVVRKTASGYELIAGERRLRAAKRAGLKQVPVVLRKSTDRESLQLALVENIQRKNLNCVDEALAYLQLSEDFQLTQEEIAQRVGKDSTTISNSMRILKLPPSILEDLRQEIISLGHAKVILSVASLEDRLYVRNQIVEKQLSVRQTEKLVELMKSKGLAQSADHLPLLNQQESQLLTLEQELTRFFSSRVEFKGSEKKGKIVVHYSTRNDLDRILDALRGVRL